MHLTTKSRVYDVVSRLQRREAITPEERRLLVRYVEKGRTSSSDRARTLSYLLLDPGLTHEDIRDLAEKVKKDGLVFHSLIGSHRISTDLALSLVELAPEHLPRELRSFPPRRTLEISRIYNANPLAARVPLMCGADLTDSQWETYVRLLRDDRPEYMSSNFIEDIVRLVDLACLTSA